MDKKYLLKEYASFEYQKDEDLQSSLNDRSKPLVLTGVIQRSDTLNKNGRIYSKDILFPEIENYNNLFVKTNSAFGELDHCLTKDYQIYTTNGWKYLKNISDDEEIYTLNPETLLIEKEVIQRKIAKSYTGTMYKFCNRNKELFFCTPNHKFVMWDRNKKFKQLFAEEIFEKLEAKDSPLSKSHLKIGGKWIGNNTQKEFQIPGTDYKMPLNVWAGLFGIWIAEGYVRGSKGGNSKSHVVGICQKKEKETQMIRELLSLSNMPWKEVSSKDSNNFYNTVFYIRDKNIWNYFKQFGNSYTKFIPKEFLDWNPEILEVLLKWMLIGDGRNRIGFNDQLIREYCTTSLQLAKDTEEIFFKLGVSSRFHKRIQKETYIEGRLIKAENCKPLYIISENKTNIYLDSRHMKREKYEVQNEMVYCVTTKNGNFLTRYKDSGRAHWTGNSDSPIVASKNISHLIKKIWYEGNVVYAKIEVLDNPNGDIVRSMIKAGGRPGISSRAVGSLEKRHFGNDGMVDFVKEDLQIICWDIVIEPSTPGAYMVMSEARELKAEELHALNENNSKLGINKRSNKISRILDEILSLRK